MNRLVSDAMRQQIVYQTICCLIFFILLSNKTKAQVIPCDSTKINHYSIKDILHTLSKNPVQSDCYFEQVIENNKYLKSDSIEQLFTIWQTVSTNLCHVLRCKTKFCANQNHTKKCETSFSLYKQCGQNYFEKEMSIYATSCNQFNCNDLDTILNFKTQILPLTEAKKLSSLLAQKGCTNSEIYFRSQEVILEHEPNFNLLFNQAEICKKLKKYQQAYSFYLKAEKISQIQEQKSSCYLGIAQILEKQKEYAKAKDFGILATEADNKNQESFVFLATLYQKAEQLCSITSDLEKCALHLLIARMYEKANKMAEKDLYFKKSNFDALFKNGIITPSSKQKIACFINIEIELNK